MTTEAGAITWNGTDRGFAHWTTYDRTHQPLTVGYLFAEAELSMDARRDDLKPETYYPWSVSRVTDTRHASYIGRETVAAGSATTMAEAKAAAEAALAAARCGVRLETARKDLKGALDEAKASAVALVEAGVAEAEAARLLNLDRMTVRKALGKR